MDSDAMNVTDSRAMTAHCGNTRYTTGRRTRNVNRMTTSRPLNLPIAGRSSRIRVKYHNAPRLVDSAPIRATQSSKMDRDRTGLRIPLASMSRSDESRSGGEGRPVQVAAHGAHGRRVG